MKVRRKSAVAALVTLLLLSLASRFYLSRLDNLPEVDLNLSQIPAELGSWQGRDTAGLDLRSQEVLRLDHYLKRRYDNPQGEAVFVYIGYWKLQTGEHQAAKHSPELCLPSSGWHVQYRPAKQIALPEDVTPMGTAVKRIIGESGGQSYMFYYWFFTGEKNYSEEWQSLLNISLQTLFSGRSDGGIVELSTPIEGGKSRDEAIANADRVIEDFITVFYPALSELIHNPQVISK